MKPFRFFKLPVHVIVIFVVLTAAVAGIAFFHYKNQKDAFIEHEGLALEAIADLKVGQIERWWGERMGDASFVYEDPIVAENIVRFVKDSKDGPLKDKIRTWMADVKRSFRYASVRLADAQGKELLADSTAVYALSQEGQVVILEAIRTKRIAYSDMEVEKDSGRIHIHIAVPFIDKETAQKEVKAALLIAADPAEFLFPLLQTWPVPSETGETLLVRRDGDEVVYLTELRHKKTKALELKFPVTRAELPSAMAVMGKTGLVGGMDYRGVPVLAALCPVEGLPWFVVAKIDRAEVLAPIEKRAGMASAVLISFVLAAGAAMIFRWRQREAESLFEREMLTKHYEYLTKYANDIIIVADSDKRIVEVNEKVEDVYGYDRKELIGMHIGELRAPDEVIKLDEQLTRIISEKGKVYETIHKRRDGSTFPVEVSARIIETQGRGYYQAIVRDITERKQVEGALRALTSRYEALLMADPNIVMEVDNNKVYTWANKAGYEFFGDDVVGREAAFYFEGEQETYYTVRPVFEGKEDVIYVESWQRRRDGEKRLLAWWCRALMDRDGKVTGALSTARDITDLKKAEEALRDLTKELERRVELRTNELQEAYKEMEAFSYSVSHDLRAPLRAMAGFSEALLEDYAEVLDKKGTDYLMRIYNAGKEMGVLIDDILDLARITRSEMTMEDVDLSVAVEHIAGDLKKADPSRDVEFSIQPDLIVFADRQLITDALENLLENAWKFSAGNPAAKIEFGSFRSEGKTIYFVKDNGVGFDMTYVGKLFGPFQRLHAKEEFPGTGIGLATVQRIINRHGGRVWAEARVNEGATFYFTLHG